MGRVDLDTLIGRIEESYDADELVDMLSVTSNDLLHAFRWKVELHRDNFSHLELTEDYLELIDEEY